MEYIIRDELMKRCKHLLNEAQHGFMPKHSCTTQMIPFIDSLTCSLNAGTTTDVIYFDFQKAFDSVNHDLILYKLKNKFNIDGALLCLIKNYLKNRQQAVTLDKSVSSYKPVLSGVPQGSILGPLLFVIFINDICDTISPESRIALYADDTKLWREINSYNDHITLQNDIDSLHNWSSANKMKFNSNKCAVLSIKNSKHTADVLPFSTYFYMLGNELIDYTNEVKDLGILINPTLNWSEHFNKLYSKANSTLGLLKRSCSFTTCHKQRRVLYLTLVCSLFQHLSVIWARKLLLISKSLKKFNTEELNGSSTNLSASTQKKCIILNVLT